MSSLTSSNSIILLTIAGVYDDAQPLQGFTADDIFDVADINPAEVVMGLDGKLSAGYVPQPTVQTITLQADSPSMRIFDDWYRAQKASRDIFFASATVTLTSVGTTHNCVRGVLTGYKPAPDAKKILSPRKFQITWQDFDPSPI